MKNQIGIIATIFLLFSSCTEEAGGKKEISLIHKRLIGEWKEQDTDVLWEFRKYDMKWKAFEHYYVVDSTQLTISNLKFIIKRQEADTITLLDPDQKMRTLVRCKKDSSQIIP